MNPPLAVGAFQDRPEHRELLDEICALWVDEAPRSGAVAVHFPRTVRTGQDQFYGRPSPWLGFVASFWAPEMMFSSPDGREGWYRDLPESPRTRAQLDSRCAHVIGLACWVPVMIGGAAKHMPAFARLARPEHRPFWSPELPEVRPAQGDGWAGIWCAAPAARIPRALPGWMWRGALTLLLLCLALPAGAQSLFGVISRVSDGDTLTVGKTRVRLSGIDAPERRQVCDDASGMYACGETARTALLRLAPVGSSISCRVVDTDRYGRLVAVCSSAARAGSDLGREMVAQGWAVAYRRYSTAYVREEEAARAAHRGIWAGPFVMPEEWRKGGRP